jgi:hypothetical protein
VLLLLLVMVVVLLLGVGVVVLLLLLFLLGVVVVVVLLLLLLGVVVLLLLVVVVVLLLLLSSGVVVVVVLCWPPPAVLLPLGQISSSSSKTSFKCNATTDVCNVTLPGMMAEVASHNPLASQGMDSIEDAASASAPAAGPGVCFQAPSLTPTSASLLLLLQAGVL